MNWRLAKEVNRLSLRAAVHLRIWPDAMAPRGNQYVTGQRIPPETVYSEEAGLVVREPREE